VQQSEPTGQELVDALSARGMLVVHLDPAVAFAMVAALQLALRHPDLASDGPTCLLVREAADRIAAALGPGLAAFLERGWDASQDIIPDRTERR
jgi:hypothetical protein